MCSRGCWTSVERTVLAIASCGSSSTKVNAAQPGGAPFPHETYRVRQEVNTGIGPDDIDIADIVLTGETAALVVENYFTSDGHQHGYERYLAFGQRDARRGGGTVWLAEPGPGGRGIRQ